MPVLEKTESGIRSSEADDLTDPLINKIRDGKLTVPRIDPLEANLGIMAKLGRDKDLWIITCYPAWNAWKSILGMIILVLASADAYLFELIEPEILKYFFWALPLCMLATGISIRRNIARPEQVALDRNNIYYRRFHKKKGWVTDDVPLKSLYRISVKKNPMHFRSQGDIVVEGKNRAIRFGWWLPEKTKLRIEGLLLSLIARKVLDD